MEINIDKYLSEEEKKQIAEQVFYESIKESIRNIGINKVMSDFEQLLSNAVFNYIEKNVSDTVCQETSLQNLIKIKTEEGLKSFLENKFFIKHYLFDYSIWHKELPIGDKIVKEVLNENINSVKEKLVKALMQLKVKDFISVMEEFLKHKK